jgi:hypothetical protein
MRSRFLTVAVLSLLACFLVPSLRAGQDEAVPRPDLMQDTRQLTDALQAAHPDPYTRGGGKVAFYRRLHELQAAIPSDGMTRRQFYRLLLPFVAAVGDSHTGLRLEGGASPLAQSPEMPAVFRLVERALCIYGIRDSQHKELIGARLRSVEKVPVGELLRRQRGLRGIENEVLDLALLGLGLSSRSWLAELVPEWVDQSRLTLELETPDGTPQSVALDLSAQAERALHTPDSRLTLPDTDRSEIAWGFSGPTRSTAILRIDGMEGYREAFESFLARRMTQLDDQARAAYQSYQGKPAPEDIHAVVAGLPAASDAFAALVEAMHEAGTRTLIVDLRKNTGGNSIMKEILIYFLYGEQVLETIDDGYQIRKLSPLYFEMYSNDSLEQINRGRRDPLGERDYDFSEEIAYRGEQRAHRAASRHEMLAQLPSFQKWYQTGTYHRPRHSLAKVIVLSSPFTYSSGFNLMQDLLTQGAVMVGTPSAQSANNFGDSLILQLHHSGITAFVSYKVNVGYPADPASGHIIQPDHPLTWERWASWGFDPNAEVLLGLELADEAGPP